MSKIVTFSLFLCILTSCGAAPRKKIVTQGDSQGVVAGLVNGKEWLMSGGEARLIDYEGGPKVYVVLWGPILHTPCKVYHDTPDTDARSITFLVDHVTTTQQAKEELFAFTFPEGERFASTFADTGTVELTAINGQSVSGKIDVSRSTDGKSMAIGSFTVQVCP